MEIAIGFDPGTRLLGWGVVRRDGNRLQHVDHGVVKLDGKKSLAERLVRIEREVSQVLEEHQPDVGSVENIFFSKDAQAAAKLGHARGVLLLLLARAEVKIAEYPPTRVKQVVTGHGHAEKTQVARMVTTLLSLPEVPPADAADALALAVTHLRVGAVMTRLSSEGRDATARALLRSTRRGSTRRRRP